MPRRRGQIACYSTGSGGGLPTFERQTNTCSGRIELGTMCRQSRDREQQLAIMQTDLCFLLSILLVPPYTLTDSHVFKSSTQEVASTYVS